MERTIVIGGEAVGVVSLTKLHNELKNALETMKHMLNLIFMDSPFVEQCRVGWTSVWTWVPIMLI